MKSLWNGSISFGLVNIPVKLYSAIESKGLSFKMFHKQTKTPIRYKKWAQGVEQEVEKEDIVKGFEVSKGNYFILSNEELDEIKPKNSDTIEILEFINTREIDPILINKHYFIGPSKEMEKTYFLFREILSSTAKIAIGKMVMREKEHICAIEAYKEGLLLSMLNFSYEIRQISDIEELKNAPELKKEEIELGVQLIKKLEVPKLNISEFKDSFAEELTELIKKKARGETIKVVEKPKIMEKEQDLVEALKASLNNKGVT